MKSNSDSETINHNDSDEVYLAIMIQTKKNNERGTS